MYKGLTILAAGLALAVATTTAHAQTADISGRVVRVDPGTQIILLDNNQAVRVTPNTVMLLNNQPVPLGAIQPGQVLVIRSGEAVALAPAAPAVPQAAGNTVVITPPAASPSTGVALGQQTVYGRVTDVDRGEVKIKTDNDRFEVKVPRELAAQVRKGDTVRLDLTFQR
jgi:preprotein translocase subunit YajC